MGINYKAITSNSVGYKTDITMYSLDFDSIRKFTDKAEKIIVAEESVKIGGVGERIAATLGKNVIIKAIDGVFPQHGSNKELYKILGIDAEAIEKELI